MRMIFVRLRSLGDTVLMTPAIEVAARAGYEVGVVIEEPFDQILRGNPHVSRLLIPGRGGKWAARLGLARRIRKLRPQVVIDLHGGSTAAWLTRVSGARLRVGYALNRNRYLYNHQVPDSRTLWDAPRPHTVQHQLSPLLSLGLEVGQVPPLHVPLQDAAVHWLQQLQREAPLPGPLVLIHPAAAFETKQWAVENFVRLAAELLGARDCGIVVTAGPGQESLLAAFEPLADRGGLRILEPQPLDRFAALAACCDLYIGNDTGPTHMAAAFGKPIVVVFGSSDSTVWHPWGVPYRLLQSDLDCIPCPGYYCLHYDEPRCIRSVEVPAVLAAARDLLSRCQ